MKHRTLMINDTADIMRNDLELDVGPFSICFIFHNYYVLRKEWPVSLRRLDRWLFLCVGGRDVDYPIIRRRSAPPICGFYMEYSFSYCLCRYISDGVI